jgi:hypothetical protein
MTECKVQTPKVLQLQIETYVKNMPWNLHFTEFVFCCPLYFRASGSIINLSERDGSK